MSRHPRIALSTKKEPHWWTRYRLFDPKIFGAGNMNFYMKYFTNVSSTSDKTSIIGDGSASTAWSNDFNRFPDFAVPKTYRIFQEMKNHHLLAVHLIRVYTPNAKFIVLLRNPVERLYSDYLYFTNDNEISTEDFQSVFGRQTSVFGMRFRSQYSLLCLRAL